MFSWCSRGLLGNPHFGNTESRKRCFVLLSCPIRRHCPGSIRNKTPSLQGDKVVRKKITLILHSTDGNYGPPRVARQKESSPFCIARCLQPLTAMLSRCWVTSPPVRALDSTLCSQLFYSSWAKHWCKLPSSRGETDSSHLYRCTWLSSHLGARHALWALSHWLCFQLSHTSLGTEVCLPPWTLLLL